MTLHEEIRANVLYHVSPHENIENILREGLKAKDSFICVSRSPDSWKTKDVTVLEVNIKGMEDIRMSTFPVDETDEILIWTKIITPDRLKIYVSEG